MTLGALACRYMLHFSVEHSSEVQIVAVGGLSYGLVLITYLFHWGLVNRGVVVVLSRTLIVVKIPR